MRPAIIASVETMLKKWKGQVGKEIEVFHEFKLLTSEVISRTAFGSSYLEGEKIFEMLNKLSIVLSRNLSNTGIPFKLQKPADMLEAEELAKGIQDYLVDECKTFYFAGQDTVNSLLAWMVLLLASHGDWQEKARREVIEIFGNQYPNSEGLSKLKIVSKLSNPFNTLCIPCI
ncbi:hypothetical protein Goklo_015392 [Gossypium klotzschianum]|uniref:Cytochrome P450 n=1 Tax=Gossypium klotzschianum TaxID=34286 RepID=A0A7J8UAM1_9ROSI|nr:hypothetical protein [Gossypium klotzschianum]